MKYLKTVHDCINPFIRNQKSDKKKKNIKITNRFNFAVGLSSNVSLMFLLYYILTSSLSYLESAQICNNMESYCFTR